MKFRLIQLHFQNLNRTYLFCYSSPQGVKRPKQWGETTKTTSSRVIISYV